MCTIDMTIASSQTATAARLASSPHACIPLFRGRVSIPPSNDNHSTTAQTGYAFVEFQSIHGARVPATTYMFSVVGCPPSWRIIVTSTHKGIPQVR